MESLNCPNCGAALQVEPGASVVTCIYCNSTIRTAEVPSPAGPGALSAEQVEEIRQLLREGQRIEAIKRYRQYSDVGLKEAKDAVDALAEDMGIVFKDSSGWSCWVLVVGFLLWIAALAVTPILVDQGLHALQVTEPWVGLAQFAVMALVIVVPVVGFIVWANVSSEPKVRSDE